MFCCISVISLLSWEEVFPGLDRPQKSIISNQRTDFNDGISIYVYNSAFHDLHGIEDGGAMFFNITGTIKKGILVEKTTIERCSVLMTETSETCYGGAICSLTNYDFTLKQICCSNCSAFTGQFIFSFNDNSKNNYAFNVIDFSAFDFDYPSYYSCFYLTSPESDINKLNVSNVNCAYYTLFHSSIQANKEKNHDSLKYMEFINNTAYELFIYYFGGDATVEADFLYCNAIKNTDLATLDSESMGNQMHGAPLSLQGIKFIKFESLSFVSNKCVYSVSSLDDDTFEPTSVIFNSCYLDAPVLFKNAVHNNEVNDAFTNKIVFFYLGNCHDNVDNIKRETAIVDYIKMRSLFVMVCILIFD